MILATQLQVSVLRVKGNGTEGQGRKRQTRNLSTDLERHRESLPTKDFSGERGADDKHQSQNCYVVKVPGPGLAIPDSFKQRDRVGERKSPRRGDLMIRPGKSFVVSKCVITQEVTNYPFFALQPIVPDNPKPAPQRQPAIFNNAN